MTRADHLARRGLEHEAAEHVRWAPLTEPARLGSSGHRCTARDADPWDTGEVPSFNAYDVVGMVAAAILFWLALAGWFSWPPFA